MAENNRELSRQLTEQGAKPTSLSLQSKLDEWKGAHFRKLVSIAGDSSTAERMYVICLNTVSRNPKLLDCTFASLIGCIMQSFQLGLYPGPLQECAYVPLKNNRAGVTEANFWPQYNGLVKLMLNSGAKCVVSRVVYEGDSFTFKEGLEPPNYCPAAVKGVDDRGERRFVYAAVCTQSGMWQVEVMSPKQVNVIKSRSKGANTADSPWNSKFEDDVNWMWRKTCLKQLSKLVSKSAELATAIELDNQIDGDINIPAKSAVVVELAPKEIEHEEAPVEVVIPKGQPDGLDEPPDDYREPMKPIEQKVSRKTS